MERQGSAGRPSSRERHKTQQESSAPHKVAEALEQAEHVCASVKAQMEEEGLHVATPKPIHPQGPSEPRFSAASPVERPDTHAPNRVPSGALLCSHPPAPQRQQDIQLVPGTGNAPAAGPITDLEPSDKAADAAQQAAMSGSFGYELGHEGTANSPAPQPAAAQANTYTLSGIARRLGAPFVASAAGPPLLESGGATPVKPVSTSPEPTAAYEQDKYQWAPVTGTITDVIYHLGRVAVDAAHWMWTGQSKTGLFPTRGGRTSVQQGTSSDSSNGTHMPTSPGPGLSEDGSRTGTPTRAPGHEHIHATGATGGIFTAMVSAVDSLLVTPPPTTAPAPAPATHHLAPPSHGFAAQTLPEVDELDHTGGMVNDGGSAGNGGVTRDVARAAEKEAAGVSPPRLNPEKTLSGMVSVPGLYNTDIGGYGRGIDPELSVTNNTTNAPAGNGKAATTGRHSSTGIPVVPYTSTEEILRKRQNGQ